MDNKTLSFQDRESVANIVANNDLNRFIEAQNISYLSALNEIKQGKKISHCVVCLPTNKRIRI